MNLIIDTHVLVWYINGDKLLPDKIINLIKNTENKCYVSISSVWEIAIKLSLKKIEIKGGFDIIKFFLYDCDVEILPVTFEHIQQLIKLEYFHRDPFDRIIIAQGLCERLSIVTRDKIFKKYGVKIIWD